MSDFSVFGSAVHARYNELAQAGELFIVNTDSITEYYLAAFPEGTNLMFRQRSEYDCNCCKQFIKKLGKVVSFDADGNTLTVWDNHEHLPHPYNVVSKEMQALIRSCPIQGVFRTKERQYGTPQTTDKVTGQRWNHFHGRVDNKHFSETPDIIRGEKDTNASVLKRSLEEYRLEDFDTVIDLAEAKQFYRCEEQLPNLRAFRALLRRYQASANKAAFVWMNLDHKQARLRSTALGTLMTDLATGVDINSAISSFETKLNPVNYKRTTSLITPKMVDQAAAKLEELGLQDAIQRRMAKPEDLSVNDVLFVDRSIRSKMKGGAIQDLLAGEVKPPKVSTKAAVEISGEQFLESVVPKAKSISLLLENKHLANFVSLTAPVHEGTGKLFKWSNDFGWTYADGVTDAIKQRVKAAGGKVDAKFRISLAWQNHDDLDIHVQTPQGSIIYFHNKHDRASGGVLDVDMNAGFGKSRTPVENVYFNARIADGLYRVMVNNYCKRESTNVGFELEVEFDGAVSQFSHPQAVPDRKTVKCLTVSIKNGKLESVTPEADLVGGDIPTEKWGVKTGSLVPVETLMLSPNHWGGQAIGNKHFIFCLKDVKCPEPVRGIFNEYLRPELDVHRKVFEVLGSKTKAEPTDQQLSGLGFSSTRKDEVTAVVDGRPYLVKF